MINNNRGEGEEGEEEEEEGVVWGEVGLVHVMLEEGHRSDRMVAFVLFMAARMLDEQEEIEGRRGEGGGRREEGGGRREEGGGRREGGGREGREGREEGRERMRGEVRIEERRHTSTTSIN